MDPQQAKPVGKVRPQFVGPKRKGSVLTSCKHILNRQFCKLLWNYASFSLLVVGRINVFVSASERWPTNTNHCKILQLPVGSKELTTRIDAYVGTKKWVYRFLQ
jgi:hypothetical protein